MFHHCSPPNPSANIVPIEIAHLQENQDFQEKSRNQEKSVRTKVDKHPETAWAPLRIGSGVKICGFGSTVGSHVCAKNTLKYPYYEI